MTHDDFHEKLREWLDGELDASMSAAVAAHVGACPSCRRETELLRRLGPALFRAPAAPDPRATEAFVARVMARVEADKVSFWEKVAARVLAPALGLALAGLVFTIVLPGPDEDAPLGVAAASIDVDAAFEAAP
jgi:anti-sigma factor RsiW